MTNKKSDCKELSDTIAIIAGGSLSPLITVDNADYIIACDKGLNYALTAGITPDLFVGDGDSLSGELPSDIERVDLPVEKDDTDLMAAVKIALEKSPQKIVFYCACGGRYDHFLGNLQAAVFAAKRGVKVEIIDLYARFYIFSGGKNDSITEEIFARRVGYSFSVLSFSDICEGVCISGGKYEIKNAVLRGDFPLGVSNEWNAGEIRVSVKRGVLCVCECKMI